MPACHRTSQFAAALLAFSVRISAVAWFNPVSRRRVLFGAAAEAIVGLAILGLAVNEMTNFDLGIAAPWLIGWGLGVATAATALLHEA